MKVLFLASIHGKEGREADYNLIVETLLKSTKEVYSDHVMKYTQSDLDAWTNEKKVVFHKQLLENIKRSDIVVAEVSSQSVSVGYLVSVAIDFGKPTILMYRGNKEPNLLTTLVATDKLQVLRYTKSEDIQKDLPEYIKYAVDKMDVRFNFFISPQIGAYLDWVSKNKRIPRAVYLRRLIEKEMNENRDYAQE
ncbi:MAG: nucleoside 2-deoxyribosyltransferase [Microgenomates group bacterium GW2011_GWF2_47_9]|nr:MAG: nucleoside 2-deoxyribosyltransferase [Microgenomates group bacterium GW2011_GWF2_47_9]